MTLITSDGWPVDKGDTSRYEPYIVDASDLSCIYLCYRESPLRIVKKVTEDASGTKHEWFSYGRWEDRASLQYAPLNDALPVDLRAMEREALLKSLELSPAEPSGYGYTMESPGADLSLLRPSLEPFACSSFRKGRFHSRSFDWKYDEAALFIVRTSRARARHASIGCAFNAQVTKAVAESGEWTELYRLVPCRTVDGINDAGFCCNVNVVPQEDQQGADDIASGTFPGAPVVPAVSVCRYLLDNAGSVDEAVGLLRSVDIREAADAGFNHHWMLSDRTRTAVVEIVHGRLELIEDFSGYGGALAMTNFLLTGYDGSTDDICLDGLEGTVNATVSPHAEGLERYKAIRDAYPSLDGADSHEALLEAVRYTRCYSEAQSPRWYSEFFDPLYGTDKESSTEKLDLVFQAAKGLFESRERDGRTWHSVSGCVYDLEALKMRVRLFETGEWLEYTLS